MENQELDQTQSVTEICPYCKKPVTIIWNKGVLPSPDYLLIADWIYHTPCWDKLIEENPIYL